MPQEFSRLARLFTTLAGFTMLAACGGGGGSIDTGNGGGSGGGGGGGGSTITVSGRITFDRFQFRPTVGQGLNAASPVESPAREVVVEAVSNGTAVATTTTDANGDYSLSVPANTNMLIRARARMEKTGAAPTWSFTVRNNTNADAAYALQGDTFNSGATNQTRNLRATSGWTGAGYTGTRAAAPFAILDTVYRTKQLILGASASAQFPALDLYWSEDNRTDDGSQTWRFCPDNGDIGTSFYFSDPSGTSTDGCVQATRLPEGIYILGDYAGGNGDTDEYDSHVIAHEFGHYFEDRFSRSDSIGGEHSIGARLDLRVAFGEGWGNAFGAMALGDPVYRDSANGISGDGGFELEGNSTVAQGWFSEQSVGEILWDIFDSTQDSGDNVALGFTPIYNVMVGAQVDTDALTSIFSFATALRSANGSSAGGIAGLLGREDIESTPDDFGTGEDNTGGVFGTIPVYRNITLGPAGQLYVCSVATAGDEGNKLGNRQFLRFSNDASRAVLIRASGVTNDQSQDSAGDPDIYVHRRGQLVAFGESGDEDPAVRRIEEVSTTLAAGEYVIEVFDFEATGTRPQCMTVSITG